MYAVIQVVEGGNMAAQLHLVSTIANVLPHTRRRARDTEVALIELLDQVRAGQIQGLMYVVNYGHARHEPGVTGSYVQDPTNALGAAAKLWAALHVLQEALAS